MTESEIVVMNGDPLSLPLSTQVSDVDIVHVENGLARSNAWNKPQISVEEVKVEDGVVEVNSVSDPPSVLELGVRELDGTNNTIKQTTGLCIDAGRVYPNTPPASFKFQSPSSKFDGSCRPVGRREGEEEWCEEDASSAEERTRNGQSEGPSEKEEEEGSLKVMLATSPRSRSLPMGIKLEEKRISSNSDDTVESETGSPTHKRKKVPRRLEHLLHQERLDSAGSDLSPPESSDDSSSEGVGDDDDKVVVGLVDIIPTAGLEQDDDIFADIGLSDMQEQVDIKLGDWACKDFVPACHQLLSHCCENEKSAQVKSANVQADLRSLSNTITFFCGKQQQRLSQVFQMKPSSKTRGKRQAAANITQTFPRPLKNMAEKGSDEAGGDRSYAVKVLRSASQSLIAPLIVEASQREGFTPSLHQAIIKALQKIAWKVEACVSFSNPSHTVEIHAKIFDAHHVKDVRELMIQALPPAGPNLRAVQPPPVKQRKGSLPNATPEYSPVIPMRRGQSVKERLGMEETVEMNLASDLQCIGEQEVLDDEVWKEEEEEEEDGEGESQHKQQREATETTAKESEYSKKPVDSVEEAVEEGLLMMQSPVKRSSGGSPNPLRRERVATESEADLLGKPLMKRSSNFGGSIPNLERDDVSGSLEHVNNRGRICKTERYFRPRAFRRTTVSLSKKDVQKLGLTVAKRVDESILDDIRVQQEQEAAHRRSCRGNQRGSKSEERPPRPKIEEEATAQAGQLLELEVRETTQSDVAGSAEDVVSVVEERHHDNLTESFNCYRSVSMSDIIGCEDNHQGPTPDLPICDRDSDALSPQPNQRLALVPNHENRRPLFRHASTHVSSSSTSLSTSSHPVASSPPNFQQSYTPIRRGTEVPTSLSSEWVMVEAEKRKKSSMRGRAKASVKKSLSSSGRLAQRLIKTGLSLKNSSTSKLRLEHQQQMSKSLSAADLLDESTPVHPQQTGSRPPSRMSLSITPAPSSSSSSSYDASTLPVRGGKRLNTFARIIHGRRGKSSRSLGKSDSSDYASWRQEDEFSSGDKSFAESIETVSRNAITSMSCESEEQLLISVEMATKLQKKQAQRTRSSIGKESSSNPWFQISINTNIKQFGRQEYVILRPFKEVKKLIDGLSSHGATDLQMPRPDKKSGAKKQMKGMEDLLRSIAGNTGLRKHCDFVKFLMPDDQFGRFTEGDHSEVSFEHLMTFYTPDISSGPPGSFPSVQIVPDHGRAESSSVDTPRKSSLTGHKKGSMHYMKKDGKEDTSTFVIQEEGEDALIVACEDDHYVVVAGTFEKLVEQLACEEKPDARFVTTFLLGYRHFAKTMEFLTKLLERFHMTMPPNPTDEEIAYAEKWSYVIQLRVLDILTYWMKKCWPDIYRNPPVLERLKEFATSLKATDDHNFQYAGTNIEKIIREKMANSAQYSSPPSEAAAASASSPSSSSLTSSSSSSTTTTTTSPSSRDHLTTATSPRPTSGGSLDQVKRGSVVAGGHRSVPSSPLRHTAPSGKRISSSGSYGSVEICTLPAIQLARQLTLIELEFLRAIDIHELVVFTWDPNTPENKPYRKNLDAFIERFNKVSYWVASEICCVEDVRIRGILLEKFIEVAKHCYELKNYNTAISVLSGLSLAAVRRLKRSWDLVNEKTRKWLTKHQFLTSPTTNHSSYRRALASVHRRDPCIPYLGVFMRDLTFFNDGNNKRLKNGLFNFSKLRTMAYKFEELKRYQRSKYFFPPEDKIREFCRNLWCLSEQELYDASLRTEPREETDI